MKTETVVFDEVNAATLRSAIEREPRLVGMLQAIHRRAIVGIVVRDLGDAPAVAEPAMLDATGAVVEVPSATPKAKHGRR